MRILTYGKQKYIVKQIKHKRDDTKFILEKYDETQYNKICEEIAEAVRATVDPKEAVKQALYQLEWNQVMSIHKSLYKKKKKAHARKGCYEIVVGKNVIPMIG